MKNQAACIGHKFGDIEIVRKILRVLPRSRFGSKIDAIVEVSEDLTKLSSSTLISKLRAYETANDIAQVDTKKDKRISFSSMDAPSNFVNDDVLENLSIEQLEDHLAKLTQKVQQIVNLKNTLLFRTILLMCPGPQLLIIRLVL